MKTYTNGQRKGMMYGGAAKRKPMMYGGMATKKKPRKKAYGGGMMTNTMTQNQRQNNRMGMPNMMQGMAKGGLAKDIKAIKDTKKEKPPTKKEKTDRQLLAESDPTNFGRLSIEAGIDNNPLPTQADRIAGARLRKKR
tara:strand:- start:60 stop:473 length:414 start_codon:yes stop_codon:yes gene_type:complete